MTLILFGCGPDMDGIIATADDEDFLLPVAATPDGPDDCRACAIENCWREHRECQTDEDCKELLDRKSKKSSPPDLFCCDYEYEIDREAKRKYQKYFDCVFLNENGCRDDCDAGKYYSCVPNSSAECLNKYGFDEEIELTIRINDIRDMFVESKMYSPGEHCVCVQWVRNADNQREECKFEEQLECFNGKTVANGIRKGYTDGFGKVTISIPLEEAYPVNKADGYLRIERGTYSENDKFPTEDDIGPFIYYFGRVLNRSQEVTLYLPRKGQEENWIAVVPDSKNWSFGTGGIITAMAYDCLVTPAVYPKFSLDGIKEFSNLLFWHSTSSGSLVNLSYDVNTDNVVPGVGSFYFTMSEEKRTIRITTSIDGQEDIYGSYEIQIEQGSTTFIIMYPKLTREG